jgi:hypothetical protein
MTRLMVLFIPHLPSAATPPPKRHTAELGYIALPRRADPLSNFTEGLHTPAGLSLTVLERSRLMGKAGAPATVRAAAVLTGQERQEGRTTTPRRRPPYQRG